MNEQLKKILDCNKTINMGLSTYIEAFVDFYGEDKKEEIEEKFKNAIYIGYQTPQDFSLTLSRLEHNISNVLIDKIMLENKTTLDKEDLFNDYSFEYETLMPLYNYKHFYNLYKLTKEERLDAFIKEGYLSVKKYLPNLTVEEFNDMCRNKSIPLKYQNIPSWLREKIEYYFNLENCKKEYVQSFNIIKEMLKKIDFNIDENNFEELLKEEKFKQLERLLERYLIAKETYTPYMQELSKYYEYIEKVNKLESVLQEKYYQLFIKENIDLIPKDKRNGLEEFLEDSSKDYNLDSYIKFLFGYSLFGRNGLDCFRKEKTRELETKDENSWSVRETKEGIIEYFKRNGIDLGDNYEDYINNPKVKEIWPNEDRIKSFFDTRDRFINEFNIEFFNSISTNQEIRKIIDSCNLLDKEDCFNATLYERTGACVNPNIIMKDGRFSLFSLVIIRCGLYDINMLDQSIIHELNHLYELYLESISSNNYTIICGWDVLFGNINQDEIKQVDTINMEEPKREYELFSEIINELIAKDICRKMYEKRHYVFGDPNDLKIHNSTSYDQMQKLAIEFYNEFRPIIIKSRKNGNIQIIYDEVGKDNFDDLNSLFAIFNENFGGMKFYNLLSSLNSNEETEQTKIYFNLIKQKDEILERMRNYSRNKKEDMAII